MHNIKSIKPFILSRSIKKPDQNRAFTSKHILKMPLVVPGINSGDGASKSEEWMNKLVGKKIGEAPDATARLKSQ